MKRGTSDMVCQEDGSFSFAVKTQTIIMADDKCVSERFSNFMIEFTDMLLREATYEDRWNISQLVN